MRKTEANDLAFVIETESDDGNSPFVGQWSINQHLDALQYEDMMHLIIEDNQNNRVGYVLLTGLLNPNKAVCVMRITIKIKGQGYGKECLTRVLVMFMNQ
ncbi:hypothetical protein [Paenibacillus sp. GSMTC-2017]|uniref:hypothetical protein n=1 Tax=Paenibacillus sp. GSMTC-2017 TaxID=2794350 RepID=UPI001E43969D|nr:hypothetical protein [Paenibacillus sp. GSMTC-2017]